MLTSLASLFGFYGKPLTLKLKELWGKKNKNWKLRNQVSHASHMKDALT